ncbi:MAG: hypothetical protein QM767_21275 [Anaeromyxobacter sp.]
MHIAQPGAVRGEGLSASRLEFTGKGKAIELAGPDVDQVMLSSFLLHGWPGAGDHCVEQRNDAQVSSSATFLQLRDIRVENCPENRAAVHLLGIAPAAGEGNVYGTLLLNAQLDGNAGHGLWLDAASARGAAGTALTNVWASSASGNGQHGILFDTSRAPASRHGITNVFGSLLQGNGQAAIRASSVGNLNLVGSYFEQTSGALPLSGGGAVFPNGPWFLAGNTVGNGSRLPAYSFELGADANWGLVGLVSFANTFSRAAKANYAIQHLRGAVIGPDSTPAAGDAYVDWASAWGWSMVQVFDVNAGTWSFSSDGRYADQPHVGFGVPNPKIAAYVHVAGRKPPPGPQGIDAFPALRVDGPEGGNANSPAGDGGRGASIALSAGRGGAGAAGGSAGRGGDITLTAGEAGGGGAPADRGHIVLNGGIGQGTALKHARVQVGPVAAGRSEKVEVGWRGRFADDDYTVSCTMQGRGEGEGLSVPRILEITPRAVQLLLRNSSSRPAEGIVHCIGIHD